MSKSLINKNKIHFLIKYDYLVNFFVAFSFLHLLILSFYFGDWGLSVGNFRIFTTGLISYFFLYLLSFNWLFVIFVIFFIISKFFLQSSLIELIYIFNLFLFLFLFKFKKLKWYLIIFLPLFIHLSSIIVYTKIIYKPFSWEQFGILIHNISEQSLFWELIIIYPLIGLAKLFNKFLKVIRFLE